MIYHTHVDMVQSYMPMVSQGQTWLRRVSPPLEMWPQDRLQAESVKCGGGGGGGVEGELGREITTALTRTMMWGRGPGDSLKHQEPLRGQWEREGNSEGLKMMDFSPSSGQKEWLKPDPRKAAEGVRMGVTSEGQDRGQGRSGSLQALCFCDLPASCVEQGGE